MVPASRSFNASSGPRSRAMARLAPRARVAAVISVVSVFMVSFSCVGFDDSQVTRRGLRETERDVASQERGAAVIVAAALSNVAYVHLLREVCHEHIPLRHP